MLVGVQEYSVTFFYPIFFHHFKVIAVTVIDISAFKISAGRLAPPPPPPPPPCLDRVRERLRIIKFIKRTENQSISNFLYFLVKKVLV